MDTTKTKHNSASGGGRGLKILMSLRLGVGGEKNDDFGTKFCLNTIMFQSYPIFFFLNEVKGLEK